MTPTLVSGSVLSLPSLVQSQTPDQRIRTVQYPKQFFPLFLGDQVFASQIKTKEELYRVTPTLVSGSVLSLQSQTPDQHIETVQCQKQFILFFGDQGGNQLLWKSLSDTHAPFVQSQMPDQSMKSVQCPKQFFIFFGGQSLCITDQH